MAATNTKRRPIPRRIRVAAAVIAVAAVAAAALLQGSPAPARPDASGATPHASSVPGSGAPWQGTWAAVALGELPTSSSLSAIDADDAGIDPSTSFLLTSRTSESATAMAAHLRVVPEATFGISPGTAARSATLTPTRPLTAGATYRFTLETPDGAPSGSWAYYVRGPVRVLSTIPGNRTTQVPVRTGIEVTFDQDDVAAMADHFSIVPAVTGRFERHGRTQVFVPDELRRGTLYTVTIRAGLARTGTDLVLASDVAFQFETAGEAQTGTTIRFGRDVVDASPAERPAVGLTVSDPYHPGSDGGTPPADASFVVYKLGGLDTAAEALTRFLALPRWTECTRPLLPTAGLAVALKFTATLERLSEETFVVRLPDKLPQGWYLLELSGEQRVQAFLQVTPVSVWVSVLTDRTVVWANDVTTGTALRGATVSIGDGAAFGRSDADGLIIADTPAALIPPDQTGDQPDGGPAPILRVRSATGDVALVPFQVGTDNDVYRGEWWGKAEVADTTFWSMMFTDRDAYRTHDRIETWGYLRARDGGNVPGSVQLRLVTADGGRATDRPAIVSTTVVPTAAGSFTGSLELSDIPLGSYEVQAVVDGRVVVARWVEISVIRKPPYQLEISSDHRAVIVGTDVTWTVAASFFDGSPVPSLPVKLSSNHQAEDTTLKTDAVGHASVTRPAPRAETGGALWEAPDSWYISARPAAEADADISASASVLVFPSAWDLRATGSVSGGRLKVSGTLHEIDLEKVEREMAASGSGWEGDAGGNAVARATVKATVTELVPVRTLVGNQYDYVEKLVVPLYEYRTTRKFIRTLTVESGADGRLAFDTAIPDASHSYEIVLETHDPAGRVQARTLYAGTPGVETQIASGLEFLTTSGKAPDMVRYAVGDTVAWQIVGADGVLPSGGSDRYLYIVAQRGLRSAAVADSSTFRHPFAAADAPGVFVIGVRFTGATYAPKAAAWANFDTDSRGLRVSLTTDRERYRPGETATVTIRTTDAGGRPVAASVVLQAVDEKLYAMGLATMPDPLDALYARVVSGIVRLTATHQVPTRAGGEGEGGGAGGGDGGNEARSDFRDTLVFRALRTDANGTATTTVELSDDLTSWRFEASAVTDNVRAGLTTRKVPVGLPFFIEATIADSYLASDHPIVQLRAYGDALKPGDAVTFTVQSAGLGLAPTTVNGRAFEPVQFALPRLSLGQRSLDIAATSARTDAAGKPLRDRLVRTFDVVASRLTAAQTTYATLADGLPTVGGNAGMTTYTFTDAGRGRILVALNELAEPGGARIDRGIAQAIARRLLMTAFGRDEATLPPLTFDPGRYRVGVSKDDQGGGQLAGVSLLPYSSEDPWLASRIALLAPNALSRTDLHEALNTIRSSAGTKRDLSIAALAGLAALGEPVLADLQAAAREPDLTDAERLDLAQGLAAAGDSDGAIVIERQLLEAHGQRLGPWVRLNLGNATDTATATAELAVLAATVGDPIAVDLAAYVEAQPAENAAVELERVAYAARTIERTPSAAASFAYTIAGKRTVVQLDPGEGYTLSLTDEQRASLGVETLSGSVGVAVSWRQALPPESIATSDQLKLTRTEPKTPIPPDSLVTVNLVATFPPDAIDGCYEVVEHVPSGLAPTTVVFSDSSVAWPDSVVGQEVRFCVVPPEAGGRDAHLRYVARVVNQGTFTWEPALMQLEGVSELAAITNTSSTTIGR